MPFVRSLQPTRCHEHPPVFRFPGLVLSHFRSPLHAPPRPRARLRAPDTTRSTSTPGLRCRNARPQVMPRLGAAVTSCVATPSSRESPPALRRGDPRLLVRQCASRRAGTLTSPVALRLSRARRPDVDPTPRTHPLAVRQHRAVLSPERLPSKDPRGFFRLVQPASSPWPPPFPRLRRRSTASNSRSRARGAR